MKKNLLLSLLCVFTLGCSSGDDSSTKEESEETEFIGGVLEGGILLRTQKEVDEFAAKGYTGITASLFLTGVLTTGNAVFDPIKDISALNTLTFIGADIRISRTELTALTGLENLTSIGGDIFVCICPTGDDACQICGSLITDFCAIRAALTNSSDTSIQIRGLFTPSVEDIIGGNCSL
ncbi:hypothetical protein WIW50_06560 [Flavobacteriaceae bacterium 3-367]